MNPSSPLGLGQYTQGRAPGFDPARLGLCTRAACDDGEEPRLCRGGLGFALIFGDGDRKESSTGPVRCRPALLLLPSTCTRRTGAWNNPSRLSGNNHRRRRLIELYLLHPTSWFRSPTV